MKQTKNNNSDIEECRLKILAVLSEYNCSVCTEDYTDIWLRDNDTKETMGFR